MATINNVKDVFHRIRMKLYPNYLPGVEGAYIARINDEASLTIEQVCAAMKNRGGFTGNYEDLVAHVKQFLDEEAYQLCDGYAVNTGYYCVGPRLGGTRNASGETVDGKPRPVTFKFRALSPLLTLTKYIEILFEGIADTDAYIGEVIDCFSGTTDELLTPGNNIIIHGSKIKIGGESPDAGLFFVDGNGVETPAEMQMSPKNTAKEVIVIVPALSAGVYHVKIVTQVSLGTALKEARTILYNVDLTVE